ncbi:D-xylose transporter XylE [Phocaeicola barnesiae]|uniref:D-xylose transporter XylE n=1 Tax=Phocaeicola barnesiae TaxID=376804 RepID=UPI00359F8830
MNIVKNSNLYLVSLVSVAILGGLLFGYDTAVISGAEQALQQHLGLDAFWHGVTASSALIGCVIGGAISGVCASRLGRRDSLRLAAVLFFVSALGSYYPEFLFFPKGDTSFALIMAFNLYRIIGGVGVGLASAICPMYIAEIAPSEIRGKLVSCNQFAIIFGMLVVYFVNYLIKDGMSDEELVANGWRYMFVSEAIPAALFGILLFFVPKTPRYLVMEGNDAKACQVLERINGALKARQILSEIKSVTAEKTEGLFTYGVAVIVIGILLSVFQQAIGINAVLYYAPRIFERIGGGGDGMMQTVIMGVVNIIFTLVAIFTVEKMGRKPLLIIGSLGMAVGALGTAACDEFQVGGLLPVLCIIVYAAAFMMSWGPICWVLIAEIFPNTIRGKAVAIAVAFQWIFNYLVSSTFPAMYEFSPFFAYSIYGVICLIAAVFVWKWVPETKGKTLEEMNQLWLERNRK